MQVKINSFLNLFNSGILLPGSKSISNRLLIIDALSENKFGINNLSTAEDTQILSGLIRNENLQSVEDCGEGGTTFRFLLALRALQKRDTILTGSERLLQRPSQKLIDALNELGADINYFVNNGVLSLKINPGNIHGGNIEIDASESSQFITALMLIAPYLKSGLTIKLKGDIVSEPYLQMTAGLMTEYGVAVNFTRDVIYIPEGNYSGRDYTCPPDWSSASYWYGLIACFSNKQVLLQKLATDKYQGDSILQKWMTIWNVNSIRMGNDIMVNKTTDKVIDGIVKLDFKDNPDLAPALTVVAAVKGTEVLFTGLCTLKNKESDRLAALKTELEKTGVIIKIDNDSLKLTGKCEEKKINNAIFFTHNDHRIAMALSILATTNATVTIDNPYVINKSYSAYFSQMEKAGFKIRYFK